MYTYDPNMNHSMKMMKVAQEAMERQGGGGKNSFRRNSANRLQNSG
jgi:hypothetical protein